MSSPYFPMAKLIFFIFRIKMSDFSDDDAFADAVSKTLPTSKPGYVARSWNCIQVSLAQAQNPLLQLINNVPYQAG
jgi:hypothetical protein